MTQVVLSITLDAGVILNMERREQLIVSGYTHFPPTFLHNQEYVEITYN